MKDNFLENENPELYLKLGIVQKTLNAPKNLFNKFGKYKYRSCEGILEAVKPLLDGCTVMLSDSIESVLDRVYVKATATFTDGISKIEVTAFARESETKKGMDDSQITGTASSYARKYALNGLFLIDDTKDADTDEHTKQVKETPKEFLQMNSEYRGHSGDSDCIIACKVTDKAGLQSNIAAADILGTDQHHVSCLHHCIGSFNGSDQTPGLDHS